MLILNTRVKLVNCLELSGKLGTVKGIANQLAEFTNYIIELDDVLPNGYTNLVITQHCVEPI